MPSINFFKPTPKDADYKGTIAFSLLETVKHLSLPVSESNELIRMLLTGKMSKDDAYCDAWIASFNTNMEEITGQKSRMIECRPKPGRIQGLCYRNSVLEYQETGNKVVIGYEALCIGDAIVVVPHAFNYDKQKNIHYDTACNYKRPDANRRVYPKIEGKEALDTLLRNGEFSTYVDFSLLWGGYIFLKFKNKSFRLRTFGCNLDKNKTYALEASETM